MKDTRLAFLGAGNIAQAIIGGLLDNGFEAGNITAADPVPAQRERLAARGINATADNVEAARAADVIIISVKPDVVQTLAGEIAGVASDKLLISVAAGITIGNIVEALGGPAAVIRCMPNTPALVQCGMIGLFANQTVTPDRKDIADAILGAVGECIWVAAESDLDAVTAISGSGPAYFFYVMEAMEEAGQKLGLPPDMVHRLVTGTAMGAATMTVNGEDSPAALRRKVTSPGGTTEAALNELQEGKLPDLFEKAVRAAWQRSKALSQN